MNRRITTFVAITAVTISGAAHAQAPVGEPAAEEATPSTTPAVAASPVDEPAPDRPPLPRKPAPPIGLRLDGGYAMRELVSLPVAGADIGLALGAQPKKALAIWGTSRLLLGSTENGLDVFAFRLGTDLEGVLFDRLRLGGGAHLLVVGVGRAARNQTILSWGPAGALTARVDLIQSDGFAIFARAAVEAGYEIYDGSIFWGPTLGGGVDFDIGGDRAALK